MRKVWPYLTQGVLLCLGGLAYFLLSRKLSSVSLENFSEAFETEMNSLKSWKRGVEGELESQFERVRSIAGRIDRAKRKDKEPADGAAAPAETGDPALDEQSQLNALLAKRFHG